MKAGHIIRILAGVFVLSMTLVLIPASPALALPEINLSPGSGAPGTRVTVNGTGFESFKGTDIEIYFDGDEVAASPITIPDSGNFAIDFEVPDDVEPGTVYVRITTVIGGEVKKSFIVEEPEIELDASEGVVGSEVIIEGQGFYAGGTVDIYYYREGGRMNLGDETTDANGNFTYSFVVPDSVAGDHRIRVEDALDNEAETEFEVIPVISVSPQAAAVGDEITVTGGGFAGNSDVSVYFNNIMMADDTTNKYGSFETVFNMPNLESGGYDIEVNDDDNNRAAVSFTLAAGAVLSPDSGAIGTPVIVNGVGFQAGVMVIVNYEDTQVATAVPGNNGAFSVTFVVPPSTGGNHTVAVTDGVSTASPIFTVETLAPPAPELLVPEHNAKAEAAAHFKWEDVEDDSGVTYILQVATKDSFSDSHIVLEKTGLIDAEYDIAEGEELEASSKESPHYWRVKAVDGADNEGDWSDTGTFYVGSSFTIPATAQKVLIGLAIAGAGFLGFWIGRRTAYAKRA